MAIEDKVALEAIKPASGFISALIAPKVQKVKKWAEGRELRNQLDSEVLANILEKYLNTLASRVSVISSICFPQKEFPIDSAYEPLYLEDFGSHFYDGEKLPVSNIIDDLDKSCLIIDGAGMGKSTFAKYLITQILYKSERIPVLFELRKSQSDIDLIESIAKELDPIGKVFSRELFYELIQNGKFIIVLDGFDEVEIERQRDVAKQINEISIKGKNNTLLLTTRPQELIPDVLNANSYKFASFTMEQAKSLVNRLDNISNLDIGKRLVDEFSSVPPEFLKNPLLVSLLYTTFGSNNTIADRICTFYSDVYHALFKGHDLINKNGFEREKLSELDYEQFRVLLRALCFQMVLKRKTAFQSQSEAFEYINSAVQLSKVELKSPNSYFNDLLNSVPLLQKDGSDYKFLHKTIIEYFAAEYIVYRSDSEKILTKMFHSKSFYSFDKVFDFVYELASDTYDTVVTKCHADRILATLDLSNESRAILSTANYIRTTKIGILSVEGNATEEGLFIPSEDGEKNKRVEEPRHEVIKAEDDFNSWSWFDFSYKGEALFLVIGQLEKTSNIHSRVWNQLTTDTRVEPIGGEDFIGELVDPILEYIGINNWVKVDAEFINQLSDNDLIVRLLAGHIRPDYIHTRKSRVFSSSKVQLFLDGLQAQKDMQDELSELLDSED